jgi:hypothetical protein
VCKIKKYKKMEQDSPYKGMRRAIDVEDRRETMQLMERRCRRSLLQEFLAVENLPPGALEGEGNT